MLRRHFAMSGLLICCLVSIPAWAAKSPAPPVNTAYNAGVALYTKKDYRGAAQQFEAAMKASPGNADAIYYCALCHQMSNNWARAKQLFEYLTQSFPQSRVAPMAQSALTQLSSLGGSGSSAGSSSSASSAGSGAVDLASLGTLRRSSSGAASEAELAGVPDLVRIPFEKKGNDIMVQMAVNGKPQTFVLDTGAHGIAIGANHLKDWGIGVDQGKEQYDIGGVGDGKAKGWVQRLDLKLGPIFRKGFPCSIMDNMPTDPLLGQTFLRSFNVKVDDASRMVMLAKKGGSAARDIAHRSYNGVEIPFRRLGSGHMMVDIKINGKPFPIMFDTGCEETSFAASDWQKLGFQIPGDAHAGKAVGVLGETTAYYFNTDSIKLGSIEQSPAPISVTEGSSHSLLGMSFYGKYKYTIDTARSVIIFEDTK